MKLALGTAQFGLNYGVANTLGQLSLDEASRVIDFAMQSGISFLDTAIDYGDSEVVLGDLGIGQWEVITKLPAAPDYCDNLYKWVRKQITESLVRLRKESLYGVLLHRPEQLLSVHGPALHSALMELKSQGLFQKFGVSVYGPNELRPLIENFEIDIVQAPCNIFDRRLLESGWAIKLKQLGVELHVRSVFLQGLLLIPRCARPKKFQVWDEVWGAWDNWLVEMGLEPLQACIRYANALDEVDRVIVGVDSLAQLREVILAGTGMLPNLPVLPPLVDDRLINPASWESL